MNVDTDAQKTPAQCIGVKGVPTCRLFRKGKAVEQLHGMQTEADDRALTERQILPLADEEVQGADGERVRDLRRHLFDH